MGRAGPDGGDGDAVRQHAGELVRARRLGGGEHERGLEGDADRARVQGGPAGTAQGGREGADRGRAHAEHQRAAAARGGAGGG